MNNNESAGLSKRLLYFILFPISIMDYKNQDVCPSERDEAFYKVSIENNKRKPEGISGAKSGSNKISLVVPQHIYY